MPLPATAVLNALVFLSNHEMKYCLKSFVLGKLKHSFNSEFNETEP